LEKAIGDLFTSLRSEWFRDALGIATAMTGQSPNSARIGNFGRSKLTVGLYVILGCVRASVIDEQENYGLPVFTKFWANENSPLLVFMEIMIYMHYVVIIWTAVTGGLLGKSQDGHYFIYKNLDLETGSNRWFGNYIKFGEQESLTIFSGWDSLEDAKASCERHAQNRGEVL
jgi:hypothetical protein